MNHVSKSVINKNIEILNSIGSVTQVPNTMPAWKQRQRDIFPPFALISCNAVRNSGWAGQGPEPEHSIQPRVPRDPPPWARSDPPGSAPQRRRPPLGLGIRWGTAEHTRAPRLLALGEGRRIPAAARRSVLIRSGRRRVTPVSGRIHADLEITARAAAGECAREESMAVVAMFRVLSADVPRADGGEGLITGAAVEGISKFCELAAPLIALLEGSLCPLVDAGRRRTR